MSDFVKTYSARCSTSLVVHAEKTQIPVVSVMTSVLAKAPLSEKKSDPELTEGNKVQLTTPSNQS